MLSLFYVEKKIIYSFVEDDNYFFLLSRSRNNSKDKNIQKTKYAIKEMEKINSFLIIIILVVTGCDNNKQSTKNFITVDVMKSYPKKELILQDFMSVEYIPLETTDNFLTQGLVLAIGKDIIIVKNSVNDGDIFIFDKTTGKGLRKINRKGQGSEEYINATWVTIDEDADEMFVDDISSARVLVYDLEGKFKRSFKLKEGVLYVYIYNFDRENLICYDGYFDYENKGSMHPLLLISKKDGIITKEIQIPFEDKIIPALINHGSIPENFYPIIPYYNSWILIEPSSDTIYRYMPDHNLTPLIVRVPSIQHKEPEVFLFLSTLSDNYFFMESVKKVFDVSTQQGYPGTDLLYEKKKNAIFEYTIYNGDYTDKKIISIKPPRPRPISDGIATWQPLDSYQLVEDYKKGILKGKLKEIAKNLNEDDNPVIMLVKHK